jgi:gamma-glutamylcyclotransferase (GGCT)/AIG2-like uncharacterized protein YtfP
LRLFVYGSLKRGFSNYSLYCRGSVSIEPTQIEGRLFQLPNGYPVLELPQSRILAHGTADLRADLSRQGSERTAPKTRIPVPGAGWPGKSLVYGELLTFAGTPARLRAMDGLEHFRPGRKNPYERVLIEVYSPTRQARMTAWTYVAGDLSPTGRLIPTGKWTSSADRRPKPPWHGSSGSSRGPVK